MDEPARNDPSSSPRETPDSEPVPPAEPAEPGEAAGPAEPPGTSQHTESRWPSAVQEDPVAATAAARWAPDLPAAPFVVIDERTGGRRFAPLSPRVGVLLLAAIVVFWLLWMARDAVRPFAVGLLLVYLLDPPVRWLTRLRIPRTLAILLVYVAFVLVVVEFLNLTLSPLIDEARRLIDDLPGLLEQFDAQMKHLADIYAGLNLPSGIRDWIDGTIEGLGSGETTFDPGILMPVVSGAGSIVGAIFGYLILPVWAFYLLKDRGRLTTIFDRALPATWRPDVWATIRIVERVFGQWVRGQLLLGLVVGVTTFIGLTLLSQLVDPVFGRYAILLSIIAGVLELLPIIGPIIAAVPAVLLAATAGLEATIAALVLYTAIQQLENYLLVPKIQGDAVQLHPAAVIFALIIGGSLAGLLGAILALPITAAFRDVVRYLFRRSSPPDEAGSLEELGVELGIEPRPRTA
jgi:predicted PurR-regulated permease PerM